MSSSSSTATKPQHLSGAQIRQRFLDFFAGKTAAAKAAGVKEHAIKPSSSLIPDNPTVLLTPAGMLPFVPIFLGIEPPPTPPRATSSQKCARVSGKASDLENVGRTPHHHTFFEMLGNFSFGDYFKADVIPWAWAFVTQELGIDPNHLWVSVLKTDDAYDEESHKIWRDVIKVPEERILFCTEADNFWGPPGPAGPCGPCTEIHYDRTPDGPSPKQDIALLDDASRFTEIWNLVFMELFQDENGQRTELERKNIDTGMGLERITMVLQGKATNFDTDLFTPHIESLAELTRKPYGKNAETDTALRVVVDHARFAIFSVADGITPSNEGRGYILRMIIRRANRYCRRFLSDAGYGGHAITPLVTEFCTAYSTAYPELATQAKRIQATIQNEEELFSNTLSRGLEMVDELIAKTKATTSKQLNGEDVFKLYDTYGFPVEITKDIAEEHGLSVDEDGFEAAMAEQKERSRGARKAATIVGNQVYSEILSNVGASTFVGYDTLNASATVQALIVDGQRVDKVEGTNQPFEVVLNQTPFYPEGGGQVGDRGAFTRDAGHHGLTVVINDTQKIGDLIVHHCLFDNGGELKVGEALIAQVEPDARQKSAIHHTATHLLNSALRKVLANEDGGASIAQAGSYVSPEGARLDFTFPRGLTPTEINRVEYTINGWIRENAPQLCELLPIEEAKATGAITMAGESYGDSVRVLSFGTRSKELCGGTHAHALGDIGMVKILSEGSVASGVRRIELVAGERAYKAYKQWESTVLKASDMLKSPVLEVLPKLEKLQDDVKTLEKKLADLNAQRISALAQQLASNITIENNTATLIIYVPDEDGNALRTIAQQLSSQYKSHWIVLGSNGGGKAHFIASASDDQVNIGKHAGNTVKELAKLCGGGGGGKPHFAQAGGKKGIAAEKALKSLI